MFLTKENNIKWNWLAYGSFVTLFLVFTGVFWFDKPLYLLLRNYDCRLWHIFDALFQAEIWIAASLIVLVIFYIKKILVENVKYRNNKGHICLKTFIIDAVNKTKNSYAFYVFVSVVSASLIAQVLKVIIGRARPIFYEALNMTGFFPFTADWAFNSMPSGHTTASFAGLVMLGLLAPKIKWFTWTLAVIIGVSRVCCGAHWPTDVILGAFIGMLVADFVKHILKKHFHVQL